MAVSENFKRCSHCAYASRMSRGRYVCENGREVERNGICDRFSPEIRDKEFFERVNASMKRMEKYENGTYQIMERAPLGTNYRIKQSYYMQKKEQVNDRQ